MLTLESKDRLFARQQELEETGTSWGADRFKERLEKAQQRGEGSTVGGARKILQLAIEPTEKAILAFIEESKATRGVKPVALVWIKKFVDVVVEMREVEERQKVEGKGRSPKPVDVAECERDVAGMVAYMTAKGILDGLTPRCTYHYSAASITEKIFDELRYRRFKLLAPGLFDYKMTSFVTNSYVHMARSLSVTMGKALCAACRKAEKRDCEHLDISDLSISKGHRILLGGKLIELFAQATGLIEVETEVGERKGRGGLRKTELSLVATAQTRQWIEDRNTALQFLTPVFLPMVVPPLPWGPNQPGGYRYGLRGVSRFVRGVSKEHRKALEATDMPLVYATVNHLQNTAWKINQDVLRLVEEAAERGGDVLGVPKQQDVEEPMRPREMSYTDEEVAGMADDEQAEIQEAIRKWRKKAHAVHRHNLQLSHDRIMFQRLMRSVAAVKDDEAIYFPYNLDFRGRVYPVPIYLSPQGDDISKGLLTFADGKPLGPTGAFWLAIHGANVLGVTREGQKVSKMTLQERRAWIERNTREIRQVAMDPFGDTWWMAADEPVQFFAFCCEWARYAEMFYQGKGEEYVCSLPVAQDGSCNGLQHFSAMLKDEAGGRAVNLVPQERPQDIYQRIADRVLDKLEEIAADNPVAARWLTSGLVTRKLTKRPTMTFGYGSKRFGFRAQLMEYLKGHEESARIKALFTFPDEKGVERESLDKACSLMAGLIWDSLKDVVVAAFGGMAWLQDAARIVARNGKPIEWTVPETGFKVKQEYFVMKVSQVKTLLAGRILKPAVYDPTDDIELHKQVNAISPNVVHSLDAAALVLTVTEASTQGVESFGMVHDSYATVPADAGTLAQVTRQQFARLYTSHDVPRELAAQFQAQAGEEEIPPPPEYGELDPSVVIASDYFFA